MVNSSLASLFLLFSKCLKAKKRLYLIFFYDANIEHFNFSDKDNKWKGFKDFYDYNYAQKCTRDIIDQKMFLAPT